jgi:hypothetical protein
MILEAEDVAFAIGPAIGLETLEAGARVVENVGCRVQLEGRERLYRSRTPLASSVSCDRYVIAEFGAKRLHYWFSPTGFEVRNCATI